MSGEAKPVPTNTEVETLCETLDDLPRYEAQTEFDWFAKAADLLRSHAAQLDALRAELDRLHAPLQNQEAYACASQGTKYTEVSEPTQIVTNGGAVTERTTHIEIEESGMIGKPSSKPGFYTVTMFTKIGDPVKLRLGADAKAVLRDILSDDIDVTETSPAVTDEQRSIIHRLIERLHGQLDSDIRLSKRGGWDTITPEAVQADVMAREREIAALEAALRHTGKQV